MRCVSRGKLDAAGVVKRVTSGNPVNRPRGVMACPVVVRERSIQKMMAKEKKSYAEAARLFVGGLQPANVPSGDVSRQSDLGLWKHRLNLRWR